jgi:hypothetical protein
MRDLINIIAINENAFDYKSARGWSVDEWNQWLDSQIANGEIYKGDWTTAKDALNRTIENLSDNIKNKYYLSYDRESDIRRELNDLYYGMAHGLSELGKMQKIAKKSMDSDFKNAALDMAEEFTPIKDKMASLKSMIVTATQQRAAKKDAEVVQKKAEKDTQSTLVNVLEPFRNDYVEEARKKATQWIKSMKNRITEAGGINEIAPPVTQQDLKNLSYKERDEKQKRRDFWEFIESIDSSEYVEEQAKIADASYEAWIFKLMSKIGKKVVDANMTGNPWTGSSLSVETEDGENQIWNTQMILNTSKLGKLFNQFPTRRKS